MATTIAANEADAPRATVSSPLDPGELRARVDAILSRHPAVGFALGVVHDGRLAFFHGHGLADIASSRPITADTVFRIGSITKPIMAIAVLQLRERGLVDLDAPANDYLRAYKLVPATPGFRPATVRHLLTHTAGIPEVVYAADLLHPGWGPFDARPAVRSVPAGEPLPSLAAYYRGGLRVVAEPGSAFAYSNHGFATLSQLVEDVSGMPLDRYLREHIFAPLGMADSDLVRSELVASRLATGYALGPGGARPLPDRDWASVGATNVYATTRDLARFAAALLGGGANEHGAILEPDTLATMFAPHYRPDPRLVGVGLGCFRHDVCGHRVVGHDGIMPGCNAGLLAAPDDGVGLIAVTNGSSGAMAWLPAELGRLLRYLLAVPDEAVRTNIPHQPTIWGELCGRYRLPARVSDLRGRAMLGGGIEVFVRGGRLLLRVLSPVPALYRGLPLYPDDERDPEVFRLDLAPFGMGAPLPARRGTGAGGRGRGPGTSDGTAGRGGCAGDPGRRATGEAMIATTAPLAPPAQRRVYRAVPPRNLCRSPAGGYCARGRSPGRGCPPAHRRCIMAARQDIGIDIAESTTGRVARAPTAAVGADPSWRELYRVGGAGALLAALTYIVATVVDFTMPAPPTAGGAAMLAYIAAHRSVYLLEQVLWLAPSVALTLTALALAVALKGVNRSYAAIGGVLGVASWALTLVYPATGGGAPALIYLSDRYAAGDAAQRAAYAAAAEAFIAQNVIPTAVGILEPVGILILALLMLRGVFGRGVAVLGVVTGAVGVVAEALRPLLGPGYIVYGLLLFAWFIASGWALVRLAGAPGAGARGGGAPWPPRS
ncbi:MAG TPA: serine hydrolase domain-containing protein [Thermomicrobiales bacterium]|nr:serine hydrolase domain-containing protein [Thermomicrobiales bacterium]